MPEQKTLFGETDRMPKWEGAAAARPGTGPTGQTCGSCRHRSRVHYHEKTYQKCSLMEHEWKHGGGSDIKVFWPACSEWRATDADWAPLVLDAFKFFGHRPSKDDFLVFAAWLEEQGDSRCEVVRVMAGGGA